MTNEQVLEKALKIIGLQKIDLMEMTEEKEKYEKYWVNSYKEYDKLKEDFQEKEIELEATLKDISKTAKEADDLLSEMFEVIPDNWKQDVAKLQEKLFSHYQGIS